MLAKARAFFAERSILEVDCPALKLSACVDTHIDPMRVVMGKNLTGYLHTSPEYGMKELLSRGSGDIYQMSHVFRKEEVSPTHQPEFMMVEWYRCGFSFDEMIDETLAFTHLFLGVQKSQIFTYRKLFQEFVGIDYVKADAETLLHCIDAHELSLSADARHADKDTLLQCLMSFVIEPKLPQEKLVVIRDYPATQAALAQTHERGDEKFAERFEVYFGGLELANGYHELADSAEQRRRFEEANAERLKLGKEALPLDENFLEALERGLPDCCGVAVGFDRLMMLKNGVSEIQHVIH